MIAGDVIPGEAVLAEYAGVKEARGLGGGESRGEGADNEGGSLTPSIH